MTLSLRQSRFLFLAIFLNFYSFADFAQSIIPDTLKPTNNLIASYVPPAPNPNKYTPNLILPSPQAANLGIYGNQAINLSTGLPTPNIALFDLKEGLIDFNVGISYLYKGFKPHESVSILGRGWALNAGGVITRIIRSKADELKLPVGTTETSTGYATTANRTTLLGLINNDGTIFQPGRQSLLYSFPDGEPDMFLFNFMGLTGKFFFGEDGLFHVVSDRKLKIDYRVVHFTTKITVDQKLDHFVEFTITDENGSTYKFGDSSANVVLPVKNVEYSSTGSDFNCGGPHYITSWFLNEVTDKNGQKITFNYTNDYLLSNNSFNYALRGRNVASPVARGVYNTTTHIYNYDNMWNCTGSIENLLTTITGSNWKVNFIYNKSGDISYLTDAKLISNTNPTTDIKKFQFNYLNITNPDGLLLSNLKENSTDNLLDKNHNFAYNSPTQLLYNNPYAIDYWGYSNGANTNNTLITETPYNAIRTPNLATTLVGALTKITYPTGGSTEFEYELNEYGQLRESEFENSVLINKKPYGGLRVKSVKDFDLNGTLLLKKEYNYNSFNNVNKSSGIISATVGLRKILFANSPPNNDPTKPSFPVLDPYDIYYSEGLHSVAEIPIYYTNVTETQSDQIITKNTFTSHNEYNDFLGTNFGHGNNEMGSPSSYSFVRSLPKKIEIFKNNVLLSEKIITYNLVDRHKARSLFTGSITAGLGQSTDLLKVYYTYSGWLQKTQETSKIYDGATNIENITTNSFADPTYMQLTASSSTNSKGENLNATYKYPNNYSLEPYLSMTTKNIIAPIIEQKTFLNGTQTAMKFTDYSDFNGLNLPQKVRTQIGNGSEQTQITFNSYDSRANPTSLTDISGITKTIQYYNSSGFYDLPSIITTGAFESASYEYFPLVGLKNTTDINGKTINYEYDTFNRLKYIKDENNLITASFCYNYAGQSVACGTVNNTQSIIGPTLALIAPVALPLKLLSFSVKNHENNANLLWATANEINIKSFDIEHSADTKTWQYLASIEAKGGEANQNNYEYLHISPPKGVNFYRLKMQDRNDQYEYSKIVFLEIDGNGFIYPNPIIGNEQLKLDKANFSEITTIELFDVSGRKIFTANSSQKSIEMSNFPIGKYVLTLTYKNGTINNYNLIKQ